MKEKNRNLRQVRVVTLCHILCCAMLLSLLYTVALPSAKAVNDFSGRIWYNIEKAEAIGQSIHIKGWAYDSDAKGATLGIHLYCGTGADGSSDPHGGFSTNVYRKDVNDAYGLSGNHGFDITFKTRETTSIRVMMYTFFADGTTTKTGLTIQCQLDLNQYPKGIKVSDDELASVNIVGDEFHPNWNYTILPQTT